MALSKIVSKYNLAFKTQCLVYSEIWKKFDNNNKTYPFDFVIIV